MKKILKTNGNTTTKDQFNKKLLSITAKDINLIELENRELAFTTIIDNKLLTRKLCDMY